MVADGSMVARALIDAWSQLHRSGGREAGRETDLGCGA